MRLILDLIGFIPSPIQDIAAIASTGLELMGIENPEEVQEIVGHTIQYCKAKL